MNEHFELISEYCEVKATKGDWAIYYIEDGQGYAEVNGEDYTCNSLEAFEDLCELLGGIHND